MRKVKNTLKRTMNFVLVLALLLSLIPGSVFAVGESELYIQSVSMNETRTYITLHFNREISATTSSLYGKVKLSKSGGSLSSLSSSSKVSISGYNMYITLTSPISTPDNYFQIVAGTLSGQPDKLDSPIFDARGPELVEDNQVVLDNNEQTVTIKFSSPIKGYPDTDTLKNGYISLARTGSSFSEIIPEDDISVNEAAGTVTIYLAEWLSGKRAKFRFTAGKLQNTKTGNINLADITTDAIDASNTTATPEIDYTAVSDDRTTITIYFTERIKNAYASGVSSSVANSFLKSHILVSRGSSNNYEPLGGADTLTIGSNYLKIALDTGLSSSRNYVKIESNSLTDYYGNYIFEELTTDNITSGSSAATKPAYASAFLSSNKKIVIYFTTPVQKNSSITTSELRDRISISRNGGSFQPLTSSDSVTISDSSMTITLREPLSGSSNRVRIAANTLSSKAGALLSTAVTTSSLSAGMSSGNDNNDTYYDDEDVPEYNSVTYDSSAQRVRIYFSCDIKKVSSAVLVNDISLSRNGGSYQPLSSSDVVTISPSNAITILLSEPLTGSSNRFKIDGGTLANYKTGYVQNSSITTEPISASGSSSSSNGSSSSTAYSGDVNASLSSDLYTVILKFDNAIYNNLDSLEDLKEKIQISRNGSFKTLGADDYVRLNSEACELLIVLAEPADEYFSQIKILSGALRTAAGSSISTTVSTLPLGEATGSVRAYINNKAVNGIVTAQNNGSSVIATVSDASLLSGYSKAVELLVKIPDASSATLNVSGSVVNAIKKYAGKLAISLGDVTYFLPTSNIPTISDTDTLSISVEAASSTVSQKLASAATSSSFSIEAPAKTFAAKVVSSSGSSTKVSFPAFSDKRFLLTTPGTSKTAFTLVRVESSGTIVPVPSASEVKGGVLYITAATKKDGSYAAISASHTFSNTPSWVSVPANTLGSRLILTNTSGSDLNSSQAISRSETVSIMARTLGILEDQSGASPFFDIISDDSYFSAVLSTVAHELISGYPDSTFKPSNKLTRAEAMTIVARAMRFIDGQSVSVSSDMTLDEASSILSKFTDAGTVDNWAKVNIAECVEAGIVNGDNKGRLNPKSNVTRAELIQLMYNILEYADCI